MQKEITQCAINIQTDFFSKSFPKFFSSLFYCLIAQTRRKWHGMQLFSNNNLFKVLLCPQTSNCFVVIQLSLTQNIFFCLRKGLLSCHNGFFCFNNKNVTTLITRKIYNISGAIIPINKMSNLIMFNSLLGESKSMS